MIRHLDAPATRSEFERRLHILRARVQAGKMSIASGIQIEGLLRVRLLPNGRIDLLTVDEFTRLNANMMAQMIDDTDHLDGMLVDA